MNTALARKSERTEMLRVCSSNEQKRLRVGCRGALDYGITSCYFLPLLTAFNTTHNSLRYVTTTMRREGEGRRSLPLFVPPPPRPIFALPLATPSEGAFV